MASIGTRGLVVVGTLCLLGGCSEPTPPDGTSGSGASAATGGSSGSGGSAGTGGSAGGAGAGGSGGTSGTGGTSGSGGTSGTGGSSGSGGSGGSDLVCGQTYQRPVDVLFVVDNSGSMREEQAALSVQMPRLVNALVSGVASDGTQFVPVSDLHIGVVSTDMGLPDVPDRINLGCGDETRRYGDNGSLLNAPNPGGAPGVTCEPNYSTAFLGFSRSGDTATDETAATQLARDFACISSLGTTGCGFEQQLESALRALWPSDNRLLNGTSGIFEDGHPFIDGTLFGQADPAGPNTGFLRNVRSAPSLLAIVFVTDEEDCSSHSMGHFVPERFLADEDPLKTVGLNLRCYHEGVRVGSEDARDRGEANLYSTSRYAQAFKDLRPGAERLVMFAAIVGVPTDLVTSVRLSSVDFGNPASRDQYYDALLADSRMVNAVDPDTVNNANLVPSCLRSVPGTDVPQRAYAPRRFVKVAKEFGENAVIQSICQDDFTPAVDTLLRRIGTIIRGECPLE